MRRRIAFRDYQRPNPSEMLCSAYHFTKKNKRPESRCFRPFCFKPHRPRAQMRIISVFGTALAHTMSPARTDGGIFPQGQISQTSPRGLPSRRCLSVEIPLQIE
jgi:hypothetical protein